MTLDEESNECPRCGSDFKVQLDAVHDITLSDLTESDVENGEYFVCPVCQIAWKDEKRGIFDVPIMSSGPDGFLSEITAGTDLRNTKTSNFRLLGYNKEGELMLRDIGDMAFANDDSTGPPNFQKLEKQLGEVVRVVESGYPNHIQETLNALHPGYCIKATIGETEEGEALEFDARETCVVVEAVPVSFALDTEYVPEFADTVWEEDFDESQAHNQIPQARRTYYTESGPAADVYVFPKGLRDEEGVPLLAGMQRGRTHHLELFTKNFTGVFDGGVIDVLFIAPADRPYFAVYCFGGDTIDLSHKLRGKLGLQVVHRGWDAHRHTVYDIRYNPYYVERTTRGGEDGLVPTNGEDAVINIDSGTVEGDYFQWGSQPHEIVVTVDRDENSVEVARLRAPSARINADGATKKAEPENATTGNDQSSHSESAESNSKDNDVFLNLSELAQARLADIVALQPTTNGELAEKWGLASGSEVYQYLSAELDDYYFRDDNKYIRATERAERLI